MSLTPLTLVCLSLEFVQTDQGFKVWAQKNITKIDDLYDGDMLMSF